MSLRDKILQSQDLPMEKVHVPEWSCKVYVRTMTGEEKDHFERVHNELEFKNFRGRFVAAVTCDEHGNLLFTPDDAEQLGKKSVKALDRIIPVGLKLNGIGDDELKQLEKNL